jgi:hypothetical protein
MVVRILEHKTIEDVVIAVPLRGRDGLAAAVVELGFGGMNWCETHLSQLLLHEPSATSAAPKKVGGPGEQHFSITQAISASTRLYLE